MKKETLLYVLGGAALTGLGYLGYRASLTLGQKADPGDLVLVSGAEAMGVTGVMAGVLANADVWVRVGARPEGRSGPILGKVERYVVLGKSTDVPAGTGPDVHVLPEAVRGLSS